MVAHGYWIKKIEVNNTTYNYVFSGEKDVLKTTLIVLRKSKINPREWGVYIINLWDLGLRYNGCAVGTISEVKKRIMLIFVNYINRRKKFISEVIDVLDSK